MSQLLELTQITAVLFLILLTVVYRDTKHPRHRILYRSMKDGFCNLLGYLTGRWAATTVLLRLSQTNNFLRSSRKTLGLWNLFARNVRWKRLTSWLWSRSMVLPCGIVPLWHYKTSLERCSCTDTSVVTCAIEYLQSFSAIRKECTQLQSSMGTHLLSTETGGKYLWCRIPYMRSHRGLNRMSCLRINSLDVNHF